MLVGWKCKIFFTMRGFVIVGSNFFYFFEGAGISPAGGGDFSNSWWQVHRKGWCQIHQGGSPSENFQGGPRNCQGWVSNC